MILPLQIIVPDGADWPDNFHIFRKVRLSAFQRWLSDTGREPFGDSESLYGAFECKWQSRFLPVDEGNEKHYSIFCSMGLFNANLTDMLDDIRFDGLTFHEGNQEVLFRYYSRIFLIASEILTDFQDILIVLRNGNLDSFKVKGEPQKSREELAMPGQPEILQNVFDFINTVFKHKTRNIHSCNHHLWYYFEDSGDPAPPHDFINIVNASSVLDKVRKKTIPSLPKHIILPKLEFIISLIIHCYGVIDQKFQNDFVKFETFCKIYEGTSVRG